MKYKNEIAKCFAFYLNIEELQRKYIHGNKSFKTFYLVKHDFIKALELRDAIKNKLANNCN